MTERLAKAWDSWQRFWFAKESPLVVCVMRWPMVGMILYTHLIWTFDFQAFFADQASWQSREFVQQYQAEQFAYSFWWHVPADWMWETHFVSLLILSLFWVGFATPITGWLCFIIVVSYANRVPLAMYGLDQVNGIAALYLAIAPCGGRLSVDAWIRRRLHNIDAASLAMRRVADWIRKVPFWRDCQQTHTQPTSSVGLSIRLFQVHLCFIYLWGGLGKLQGETWWNGEAVWLTAATLDYQSNDLTWLIHFPWLYQTLSITTWAWEISFPILVWQPRLRRWVLMVGLMMHLGIGMFLGMWTFGLAMIFIYLAFVSAETYTMAATKAALFWRRWISEPGLSNAASDHQLDGRELMIESRGR